MTVGHAGGSTGDEGSPENSAGMTEPDPTAVPTDRPGTFVARDPIPDGFEPVPDTEDRYLAAPDGWRIIGKSQRGLSHQHRGSYREDAFDLRAQGRWFIIAVADGAGSCALSRLGAGAAVRAAVQTMHAELESAGLATSAALPDSDWVRTLLLRGMWAAFDAVQRAAQRYDRPIRDFASTLLLVAHTHLDDGTQLAGAAQIGDGAIYALHAREQTNYVPYELARPDYADYGGLTPVLTDQDPTGWPERVRVTQLPGEAEAVLLMTDGVADDFVPLAEHLGRLMAVLHSDVISESSEKIAVERFAGLLRYERRGSFDDRTLVCLHRPQPPAIGVIGDG